MLATGKARVREVEDYPWPKMLHPELRMRGGWGGGGGAELGAGCFTVAPSPGRWVSHGLCAIQLAHSQHRESGGPSPHR